MSTAFENLILRDTNANRPAAGKPGRLFYNTTSGKLQRDNGSTWDDCEPAIPSLLNDLSDVDAATPTDGYVLSWDDGDSAWKPTAPTGGGGGAVPDYIYLRDQQTEGTEGGSSTANTWTARVLNTEVNDAGNHCTLSSNQITLDAGTYQCRATAQASNSGAHKLRLRNVTDNTTVLVGKTCYSAGYDGVAMLVGQFTIAAGKALELQYITAVNTGTNGLGLAVGVSGRATNSDEVEIYAEIEFWKVA